MISKKLCHLSKWRDVAVPVNDNSYIIKINRTSRYDYNLEIGIGGYYEKREISVNIKPIRNEDDLTNDFIRLESIFQADKGTPEAEEMEILVDLIEAYEDKYYPI